ncbi:MAG TPA: hypothetical protein ENN44_08160 [Methanoculleus sp.]|nr:hypothetical protein [Methanoculleus sp.]
MITVHCASCGTKLFRYQKIGKGRLLHCRKARISGDHTVRREEDDGAGTVVGVYCPRCGRNVGVVEAQGINMHGGTFTVTGSALKK